MFYGVLFTVPTTTEVLAEIGQVTNPLMSEMLEYWYVFAGLFLVSAAFAWLKLK